MISHNQALVMFLSTVIVATVVLILVGTRRYEDGRLQGRSEVLCEEAGGYLRNDICSTYVVPNLVPHKEGR
jgi:hypothetical protein